MFTLRTISWTDAEGRRGYAQRYTDADRCQDGVLEVQIRQRHTHYRITQKEPTMF